MPFVGREKELQRLKRFYESDREKLAVLYGRRRVGKSELLRASLCDGELPFVFLQCRATSLQSNACDLMALAETGFGMPDLEVSDFESALKAVFAIMKGRRGVLVLDEYPCLRELLPGCDSLIQLLVDDNRDAGLKLVLCGSRLDVMTGMLASKSPLYGRAGLQLRLEPMDYFDSARFYPTFSDEDKVRLYAVFGGIPFYNARIDEALSVRENIIRLIAGRDAVFADEVLFLLRTEISKTSNAERVFEAMANGAGKFSEILGRSAFSSSPALADILNRLVGMELVRKESPINDEKNKKKTVYRFGDNLIEFYYRFVFKHRSRLMYLPAEQVFDACMAEEFETDIVPKAFEGIVRQFLIRENLSGGIEPPFFRIGSYSLPDGSGGPAVATEDDDGFVSCECSFGDRPMTEAEVLQAMERAKASGLPVECFRFFARAGFDCAAGKPGCRFFTLADLYRRA